MVVIEALERWQQPRGLAALDEMRLAHVANIAATKRSVMPNVQNSPNG